MSSTAMTRPPTDLLALLQYRLQAISIGHIALRHAITWNEPPAITIYFDDAQVIEGKATTFTNAAIEASIMHCRAILEFLGIAGTSMSSVATIGARRKADDFAVEQFPPLVKLTVEKFSSSYPGPVEEAESALAYVIHLANKGLAHTTSSFTKHDDGSRLLEIAFRGVPILLINNFYVPLDIAPPKYIFSSRRRDTSDEMRP